MAVSSGTVAETVRPQPSDRVKTGVRSPRQQSQATSDLALIFSCHPLRHAQRDSPANNAVPANHRSSDRPVDLLSRILDPETRHFQNYSISFFFGQRPTSHWRLNEQRCRARANGRDGPHGNETYFAEGCFLRPSPEECHILRRAVSRECGDRARSRSWAQTRRGRHPTKARSGTRWPETSGFRGKKKRGGRVYLTRITHQD